MDSLALAQIRKINKTSDLTPQEIVAELDKYIIGQTEAKRAVAIALRNRTRRKFLPDDLKDEISPKNIIMIGSTGIGKTEIARRLAKFCGAPFIKVEATKYTEVGYVGRDVESMIRDLLNAGINLVKNEMRESVKDEAEKRVKDKILKALIPERKGNKKIYSSEEEKQNGSIDSIDATREKFEKLLDEGYLDDSYIEISVYSNNSPIMEMFSGVGFEAMGINLSDIGNPFGGGKKEKKRKVTVKQAKKILLNQEIDAILDMDKVVDLAIERVENDGIVFIDEIDKIAIKSKNSSGADVSREGVQRDLLPIIEGSQVNTKYGVVSTAHILFIAAGAFHMSKPSDLIPELQGRFPIRVELKSLSRDEFVEILTKPRNAMTLQYQALLKTEEIDLEFTKEAIEAIAEYAYNVNNEMENIGARRLYTILEKMLEDISFNASEIKEKKIAITKEFVDNSLKMIVENKDISKYIL